MVKRKKPMQQSSIQTRSVGRPRLSAEGSTQVAILFPHRILDAVQELIAERGGVTDRATVLRELVAEALMARGKLTKR